MEFARRKLDYALPMPIPMNPRRLKLSGTLGDAFIQMYFISSTSFPGGQRREITIDCKRDPGKEVVIS